MNRVFKPSATIAPTSVEFQIHQVVNPFQVPSARKDQPKKRQPLRESFERSICRSSQSKGTNAPKIKGVKPRSGHDNHNNSPVNKAVPNRRKKTRREDIPTV